MSLNSKQCHWKNLPYHFRKGRGTIRQHSLTLVWGCSRRRNPAPGEVVLRADAIGLRLVMERPNPRSPTATPCNSRSPVVGAGIWEAQPVGDAAGPPWRRKWAWRRRRTTAAAQEKEMRSDEFLYTRHGQSNKMLSRPSMGGSGGRN